MGLEKLLALFWERSSWLLPARQPISFSFLIFSMALLCRAVWLTACEWESKARCELWKLNFQILVRTRFIREAGSWSWPVGAHWGWWLVGMCPPRSSPHWAIRNAVRAAQLLFKFWDGGVLASCQLFLRHFPIMLIFFVCSGFFLLGLLFSSDGCCASVLSYVKWLFTRLLSKYTAGRICTLSACSWVTETVNCGHKKNVCFCDFVSICEVDI